MSESTVPDALIIFTPSGKRGRFPLGTPVLLAARQLGVDVDSVCGGRAICGRCQVLVSEGEFAKFGVSSSADSLSGLSEVEKRYARIKGLKTDRRLSCQAQILGDVVVDVPASSQVHHQVVRKAHEVRDIELDPVIHLCVVDVEQPDMENPTGDLQRLYEALAREWDLHDLVCDVHLLQTLQQTLRDGKWQVTVAVRLGSRIVGVWPGFRERVHGIALDIGSTTIAAHLCDLTDGEVLSSAGMMNPQIRFGEDLMSRVSFCMQNSGGAAQLTSSVREAINELIVQVTEQAELIPADVLEITLVGNPIMHHLALGIDPVNLGVAPFALATDGAASLRAEELQLTIHPGGHIYALPCIAGHVGADTAAVILAEAPHLRDDITLIVDVGTNAEIVLGNRERLLAASSPTGPAFEGAQISSGQRAAPGAIERVRIDPDTLEPRFRVIGSELWSDEPGFEDVIDATGITGICGSGIIEAVAEMLLAGVISRDGVVNGNCAARSPRVRAEGRTFSYTLYEGEPGVCITQNDIRAIQLAKAALYAGARLLMERFGTDKVDRIRLAGAFGNHIDVKYAMVLGMIPDCDLSQVSSAGNAAGTGARIALLNKASRAEISKLVRRVEKIETAVAANFQEHFVNALAIPNRVDTFPLLRQQVVLPVNSEADSASNTGRRRRRSRRPD
jgi:uncharacterized 2Fe-2S/4Fe-4S cluster protein (DUF4445 family)